PGGGGGARGWGGGGGAARATPPPGGGAAHARLKDLGFDSLTALQLRTALVEATGLRLAAGVVFDFETPLDLARHLIEQLLAPAASPLDDNGRSQDEN
ncbi:acyl carrier protein, partial [Streptomyces pseudogriseolus]|uniref:acyl carrier protein n=1 Tax=Streptomyces pseudogriseolus TaxID=36817 RepID=UPI003FA2CDDC